MKKGFYLKMELEKFTDIIISLKELYRFVKKQYGFEGLCAFNDNFVVQTHCRFNCPDGRYLEQTRESSRILSNDKAKKEIINGHLDGNVIEVFIYARPGRAELVEKIFNVIYPNEEDLVLFEAK